MKTNRQAHEAAAGMPLDDLFFKMAGIDPDGPDLSKYYSRCKPGLYDECVKLLMRLKTVCLKSFPWEKEAFAVCEQKDGCWLVYDNPPDGMTWQEKKGKNEKNEKNEKNQNRLIKAYPNPRAVLEEWVVD